MADSYVSSIQIYLGYYTVHFNKHMEHLYSEERKFCKEPISDVAMSKPHVHSPAVQYVS